MFSCYAERSALTVLESQLLVSGSVDTYPVRFEFSADWDGLARTAIFRAGTESRAVLLDESCEATIPWEVLQASGVHLFCGVYGTQGGHTVLPTIWADLGTIFEGATPGEEARPPTPELWEQQLARKGDGLRYDGLELALMSGDEPLSTVQIAGGGEGGVVTVPGPKGDKGDPGPEGPPGAAGTPGKDATINGQKALEIVAGENISLQQEDGTLTISAAGGGSSGGEVYSTEEIRIGTWIDGRPLYRRTWVVDTPMNNDTFTDVRVNITERISTVSINGSVRANGLYDTQAFVINGQAPNGTTSVLVSSWDQKALLVLQTKWTVKMNYPNAVSIVTLEYTKTTDPATIQLATEPVQDVAEVDALPGTAATAGPINYNEEV